jgi:hypothetical protein|nr:MAG TPA: hypothetical protein [Caudoviricetes sp.]
MPKWTEYTSKDTLADNDEVMLYDATARANKRGLMSKFWDYVVDKMATAVISKLETNNKTIIGAINALYSETKKYISRAEYIKTENNRTLYRIAPIVSDISVLCINRTGLYLITLGQTGGVFNNASVKKIYEGGNDAKIQIGENRKSIIFECDIYSNPIFISVFK